MARRPLCGPFEQALLSAIMHLRDDAYGVTIYERACAVSRSTPVSLGRVYYELDRLEDKGMVSSRLRDPKAERGGRAKRCYRLEALGERAAEDSAVSLWESLPRAWGKEVGRWNPRRPKWNPARPK